MDEDIILSYIECFYSHLIAAVNIIFHYRISVSLILKTKDLALSDFDRDYHYLLFFVFMLEKKIAAQRYQSSAHIT